MGPGGEVVDIHTFGRGEGGLRSRRGGRGSDRVSRVRAQVEGEEKQE